MGVISAGLLGVVVLAAAPAERFRDANEAARGGDYPKAIAGYQELASSGTESASLYWNWAQAASARGTAGEALYALLRARALDPGDRAVAREIERQRQAANLDAAEIEPEPLAALARWCRRLHLATAAIALAGLSLALHAAGRFLRWRSRTWWAAAMGAAVMVGSLPLAASLARPTAVVVRRTAPLLESASQSAAAVGTLREGEVVPVLDDGGAFLRVEDSSGARGWAHVADVRRLDRAPAPPAIASPAP
jgi:hypothetical protein